MPNAPPPSWLSLSAYARAYGVARSTVYKWLEAGLLVSFRRGPLIRIQDRPPKADDPPYARPPRIP